ncbi:MAG: hypothetical protein WCT77_14760 [Bacteroidota bacterium]
MIKIFKWIGISGSWRATSPEIEKDVRTKVRDIVISGNGIITGGALNVDYQATDEVLKLGKEKQLKIFLPTTLQIYAAHYRKRAQEGVITFKQAEDLILQLQTFQDKNPNGLMENFNNIEVDKDTYYERNLEVVNASDEL